LCLKKRLSRNGLKIKVSAVDFRNYIDRGLAKVRRSGTAICSRIGQASNRSQVQSFGKTEKDLVVGGSLHNGKRLVDSYF
jgi:hypothetical protein